MHGKLEYTPAGSIQVTGLLNWYVVCLSVFIVPLLITWGGENPFLYIFPVFYFGQLG